MILHEDSRTGERLEAARSADQAARERVQLKWERRARVAGMAHDCIIAWPLLLLLSPWVPVAWLLALAGVWLALHCAAFYGWLRFWLAASARAEGVEGLQLPWERG